MTSLVLPSRNAPFIFISGGCRSGKSRFAQNLAEFLTPAQLFLATADCCDSEMQQRILQHRQDRGPSWRLLELHPEQDAQFSTQLQELTSRHPCTVLLDCLTLWVAARMDRTTAEAQKQQCLDLLGSLWRLPQPVIIVSNEVGLGIVPSSPSGRLFRDRAGLAGQLAARQAQTAVFMVSGLPLLLKGQLPAAFLEHYTFETL